MVESWTAGQRWGERLRIVWFWARGFFARLPYLSSNLCELKVSLWETLNLKLYRDYSRLPGRTTRLSTQPRKVVGPPGLVS